MKTGRRRVVVDLGIAALAFAVALSVSTYLDLFEVIFHWTRGQEHNEVDELIFGLFAGSVAVALLGAWRWYGYHHEAAQRLRLFRSLEAELDRREKLEDALRLTSQEAHRASRTKSTFLAHMSHELRTPLNVIIGFGELLKGDAGEVQPDKAKDYANSIVGSGRHLLSIVDDMLDLSKIEQEALELDQENFSLPRLLEECRTMLAHRAASKKIKLRVAAPTALKDLLFADRRRVRQILINVIDNALKFTPEGGSVEAMALLSRQGQIMFSCRDTGIGMDQEDIAKALQPFGRARELIARDNEGAGLGLPLCRQFAKLHDARFELESEKGEGTTVRVIFPRARTVPAFDNDAPVSHATNGKHRMPEPVDLS